MMRLAIFLDHLCSSLTYQTCFARICSNEIHRVDREREFSGARLGQLFFKADRQ